MDNHRVQFQTVIDWTDSCARFNKNITELLQMGWTIQTYADGSYIRFINGDKQMVAVLTKPFNYRP